MENINDDDGDDKMIIFLRNLATSIEQKKLLPVQLQRIGEFFMSYKFQEQAIADGNSLDDGESSKDFDFNEEDFMKFLVLGWYIYVCILKNKSLPVIDEA
tara:strand:+ start:2564 stop:2863 length:300 start_codon:yes stop_codon:yes gene_type:complete